MAKKDKKPKNSGPFLRGKRGIYYCWIEGHLLSLRTDKPRVAQANYQEKLKDFRAAQGRTREAAAPAPLTVRECFDLYLEYAKRFDPATREARERILDAIAGQGGVGPLPHDLMTHDHLLGYLARNPDWSSSYLRLQINIATAAFNFCIKRKRIAANPLQGIEKPRWERRKQVISPADSDALRDAATGAFADIFTALRETGARPSELCRAEVRHYRDGMIVLDKHKEDRHVETRTIHLTPELRARVEALIGSRTEGPIWRNTWGRPWKPNAIYKRFVQLRERHGLGDGVFPYAMRHRFASDAINESDANPAMVARLLGHANMDMLMRFYLHENPEAAQKALEEIRRKK
jgi:integrase